MQSLTAANLDWTTGTSSAFGLPGTLNLPDTLTIDPGGPKTLDANFTDQSTVTQNDAVAIGSGVAVLNGSAGTWNLSGDPGIDDAVSPGATMNMGAPRRSDLSATRSTGLSEASGRIATLVGK
jgi:hypothetical protein